MKNQFGFKVFLGLTALASSVVPHQAPASEFLIEEVVVTAQKREQNVQDVGISVTAMTGEQMKGLGMETTTDVVAQVPALQLVTYTPAFTIFSLRGVSQNNFQDNLEAPVGVYVDDSYVASMNAIGQQMFDMNRVEVLRGPQGTLFGRNTTGGLIHYHTNGADDTEFNGYVTGSVSEFSTRMMEGAIGGGNQQVRGRIAAKWRESDGYVESVVPGIRDTHGADGYAIRASLQVDFSDFLTGDFRISRTDDDDVPSGSYTVAFAGFDPNTGFGTTAPGTLTSEHEHASTLEGRFDREVTTYNAKFLYGISDSVELTSITNYLELEKFYLEDAGGGFGYFPYTTQADFDQFSQELRFSGQTDRMVWQAGAYFLDMSWDLEQSVAGALILGEATGSTSDAQRMVTPSEVDSKNWSVFGQVEFDLSETVSLIAGARWSQDDKDIELRRIVSDLPAVPAMENFNIDDVAIRNIDSIDYGDWAGRLQLNVVPNNDTLVYFSINRGIKGGNWSPDPLGGVANENLKHDEETLLAYEIGYKTTFSDNRVRLNAAAFYYDYKDYQTFSLVGLTPQVANSDATAVGGEIELLWVSSTGLDLMLGAAFIDSEVDQVPDVFGGTVKAELPTAPGVSLNFLARYEWELGELGYLSLQADGNYNGDQYIEGTNSAVSKEDAYAVLNASLNFRSADDSWDVSAWVDNFTNEKYRLYNLDLGLLGFVEQVYAPPRWYGVTATYRW